MSTLVQDLRSRALELGFAQLGVTPAERVPSGEAFLRWLDAGHAATLDYLIREPERRVDPRIYWPEARSLVVVTLSYAADDLELDAGPLDGLVARYALGLDYHEVMKAKLMQLGAYTQERLPGVQFRAVVDTAPVLERAHAVQAGLGWFGKNSMLLNRQLGSYTLLGVLLLDRALPVDGPTTAHCGTCTRCIDACPTAAIVAPGVVDSRRCISYLTIELKGSMPVDLRPQLANRVFGCDICQEVCPWVKKAGSSAGSNPLQLEPARRAVPLATLVTDSPEQFSQRWKKSPVKRTKRVGMARNAAVLLGNSADRDGAVPLLKKAIQDEAPLVRAHAAWGLGQQGGSLGRSALEGARAREPELEVRAAIDEALEKGR